VSTILAILTAIGAGIVQDLRTYFQNKFGYFAAVSAYVDALATLPSDGDAELTHPWVPVEVPDDTSDDGQVTRPMLIVPIPAPPAPTIQVYEIPFIAPFAPGSFYDGVYRSLLRAADEVDQK
jgi:hypothetical protein